MLHNNSLIKKITSNVFQKKYVFNFSVMFIGVHIIYNEPRKKMKNFDTCPL